MIAILAQLLTAALAAAAAAPPAHAVVVEGRKATASATSQLAHKDPKRYAAANAFDGDPSTAWVEGVPGLGKGEALTLRFDQPTAIEGVLIVAGYAKSGKTLTDNGVPTKVLLALDGKPALPIQLYFARRGPVDPDKDATCRISGDSINLAPRLIVLPARSEPVRELTIRIDQAEQVGRFDETAISELLPIVEGGKLSVGGRSYAAAAQALIALRQRQGAALPIAEGANVETLLPFPDKVESLHAGEKFEAFITERGAASAPDAQEAWVVALGPELLGKAVVAEVRGDGLHLVGPLAFTHGDGEWLELFPTMDLDAKGKISGLGRAFHTDGAPGCREVLPAR